MKPFIEASWLVFKSQLEENDFRLAQKEILIGGLENILSLSEDDRTTRGIKSYIEVAKGDLERHLESERRIKATFALLDLVQKHKIDE